MITYDMPLYRPPSEGRNLIIQATLGCSFNACTFCSMYKDKSYRARALGDVFADIDRAHAVWPDAGRVFLADGDALGLPGDHLLRILERLKERFTGLTRVSCYATPINLKRKTPRELTALRAGGLSLLYFGLESGSNTVLRAVRKGRAETMVEALQKAAQARMKVSATVILGLGGRRLWREHINATAELLNAAPPTYLSTLQLTLEQAIERHFLTAYDGGFDAQDDLAVLHEQRHLIAAIDSAKGIIFRSNHASNCLALAGVLPKDRNRLIDEIDRALKGRTRLRQPALRHL
ncbi:radical SAM protein [Varunaivibrio sulfuroxidans]|uniref:Radical SAM family protein n=1 Tax=Varunaivibrio sulfuroxidans TaxID=1773489 RepID=A0A4R3JFR7_9PROT|nr:radical SAM protein [Varunaivibrio sulfuroxidans]TCS64978.1 radical SAM family protein [Varunaivibrio sulfuroxidans]WES29731.1 radical SAM protein [Varunaivibrio sulfuroxidans]